jgi:uncharacterized protein (TIGR03437 family)
MIRVVSFTILLASLAVPGLASESDALAISANIQAKHMPFGTILDPIFDSPTSNTIIGYTRCGDSALWTGGYLAAEAFRYNVTRSPDALANAKRALAGLKGLADVTGYNLLARCIVQADSPYAQGIASEESANGIHQAAPWFWVGNTSRDEFVGAIFGLGTAYDLIDDSSVKSGVSDLVSRLTAFLTGHNWSVTMPDGSSSTSFLVRPDEMLAILQVAKHVNPSQFASAYNLQKTLTAETVPVPLAVDAASDDSYFKFNLAYMCLYDLIRLEDSHVNAYSAGYDLIRTHTETHQNAFFDMIDRGLQGTDALRDSETRSLLDEWLQKPARDFYVDATAMVANCSGQACVAIPMLLRQNADFLWQRSPFSLSGGGSGRVENNGIDYILPYWMARYYGVIAPSPVSSAAAGTNAVAPDSLAALYGANLSGDLSVKDAAGVSRKISPYFSSATQVNFVVPAGTAVGSATFSFGGQTFEGVLQGVVPALFSADATGTGVAAATALRVNAGNPSLRGNVPVFQCSGPTCTSVPILLGIDTPIYVSFYGTGIRGRSSLSNVNVTIDGQSVPVEYAGPQGQFPGLDQVNVALPLTLRGAGESNVVLIVDGQASNIVTINVK